jgi:hypothetical protein
MRAGFTHAYNKPIATPQGSGCIYPPLYPNSTTVVA